MEILEPRTVSANDREFMKKKKVKKCQTKSKMQDEFRSWLGLLIDMPVKQTVNTNDGNMGRKFIQESSQITVVSLELIKSFGVILAYIIVVIK